MVLNPAGRADVSRRHGVWSCIALMIPLVMVHSSCSAITAFKVICPSASILVGESSIVYVEIPNEDYGVTYVTESDDGGAVDARPIIGSNRTLQIGFDATSAGTVTFIVTQKDTDGQQLGNPLDCTVSIIDEPNVCDTSNCADLVGGLCFTDFDCGDCQVCSDESSVPSNTCVPRIECPAGGSQCQNACDDFSVIYTFCFSEDEVCR